MYRTNPKTDSQGNATPLKIEVEAEIKNIHKLECSEWKRSQYLTYLQKIKHNLLESNFKPLAYTQTFKAGGHMNAPFSVQNDWKSLDVHFNMNEVADFCFNPEATVEGNIHYHGIIIGIKNRKKKAWLQKCLPSLKQLGFVKLKPIQSIRSWIFNYCLKEVDDYTFLRDNYLTYNYIPKNEVFTHTLPNDSDDEEEIKDFHCIRVRKIKTNIRKVYKQSNKKTNKKPIEI